MEVGLNQAVLAKVNRKIEALEYDYSQELLPEHLQKTGPDIIQSVDIQILYSYGEEHYGELVVPAELFAFLRLGDSYLFFFDREHQSFAAVVKSFLSGEGGYDWVESLSDSDKLSPEYRAACKLLATAEKEKKKRYEDHVVRGGCPL